MPCADCLQADIQLYGQQRATVVQSPSCLPLQQCWACPWVMWMMVLSMLACLGCPASFTDHDNTVNCTVSIRMITTRYFGPRTMLDQHDQH